MKAITDLQSGSRPRAILKIRPPSSLDYRARHGAQAAINIAILVIEILGFVSEDVPKYLSPL